LPENDNPERRGWENGEIVEMSIPTIMVVDQDQEAALELSRLIDQIGFHSVGEAGMGIEALTAVSELSPDLVLIRIDEPFERSLRTLARLNESMPDLPIVGFSSWPDPLALRQSMRAGACDYLEAPGSADEIERTVTRALERKAREGSRRRGELPPPVALGTIVTVFGAKGGIGKTTIATNLAISLARWANQSVALVDLDTRFGDVAIALDLQVERSMADLVRNLDDIDPHTLRDALTRHDSGVWVLPAPSRPREWRDLHPDDVRNVIDVLAQTHDFVIVDTPGAFSAFVGVALDVATVILAVTTSEIASIKDTVVALDLLRQHFADGPAKVRVLLNQEGKGVGIGAADIEDTVGQPVWWAIPHDVEVMKATQMGLPVVLGRPGSRAAREFQDMARALSGVLPSVGRIRTGRGRFGRMLGSRLRKVA